MLPFFLYLLTGIATGLHVLYLLSWAVWGAPTHPLQYISVVGSLVVIVAAYVSLFKPRIAARFALLGLAAVWPFYVTAVVRTVQVKVSDQRLTLRVLKWSPGPESLSVSDSLGRAGDEEARLPSSLIEQLKEIGLTGEIGNYGYSIHGQGERSEAIIVMQKQVQQPTDLPQPDATTIIYVQYEHGWKLYPPSAPMLRRTIRIDSLADDPRQTTIMVELANGSRQGTGVCCWSNPLEATK